MVNAKKTSNVAAIFSLVFKIFTPSIIIGFIAPNHIWIAQSFIDFVICPILERLRDFNKPKALTPELQSQTKGLIMKIFSLVLVVILAVASLSVSVGMKDSDKAAINATATQALERTGNFSYVKAEVGLDNNLSIWFTSKTPNENTAFSDLAIIVGVYWGACKSYSDLSDLNVMMGTQNNVLGKMYCKRSWIDEVKVDSAGNIDITSASSLVMRVMSTFEKVS